jgi:Sphingosine kinase and enzymes related to eukaryotic diacylglycerol kinase
MGSTEDNRSLFILNPNAGVIPAKLIISKKLEIRKNELSCFKSLSINDSDEHIKQSFDKFDVFVAAGGDGTVRTVAAELVGSQKIFGVLPMGSGNGFAKEFGFRTNITSLLSDIKKSESVTIDVIELNDQICLNVAGIGLDSFVAHSFDKAKIRGLWSYIWQTFMNFFLLKPVRITIQLEGEKPFTEDLFVLSMANTRQFGNNAFIAPDARPDDGIIDIVLIKPFPKIIAPIFVYRLFRGTMKNSKYVRYIKTDKPFTIRTKETRFHIDGEAIEFSDDVVVKIKKDVLKVLKTKHFNRPITVSS